MPAIIDDTFYQQYTKKHGKPKKAETYWSELSELRICVYRPSPTGRVVVFTEIFNSPVMYYLKGEPEKYHAYHAYENPYNVHCEQQLEKLVKSILQKGYQRPLIVVRDRGPVILDGQHRAAILWHYYGDLSIHVASLTYNLVPTML